MDGSFWYTIVVFCVGFLCFKAGRSLSNSVAITLGIKVTILFFFRFAAVTKTMDEPTRVAFIKSLNHQLSLDDGVNAIMRGELPDDANV